MRIPSGVMKRLAGTVCVAARATEKRERKWKGVRRQRRGEEEGGRAGRRTFSRLAYFTV